MMKDLAKALVYGYVGGHVGAELKKSMDEKKREQAEAIQQLKKFAVVVYDGKAPYTAAQNLAKYLGDEGYESAAIDREQYRRLEGTPVEEYSRVIIIGHHDFTKEQMAHVPLHSDHHGLKMGIKGRRYVLRACRSDLPRGKKGRQVFAAYYDQVMSDHTRCLSDSRSEYRESTQSQEKKPNGDDKMNISYEEVMERVELLTAELAKIKRALVAVNEGVPFTEAFNDELLVEWADVKHAKHQLIEMMHHLLMFRFCTTDHTYNRWFSERISLSRRELQADIEWRPSTGAYDQNIVNEIMREFDELYNNAKAMYVRDAERRSNLAYGLEHLPEKCPWTLIDLVDKYYSDLLRMIPAINDPRDRLDDAVKIIDELAVYE